MSANATALRTQQWLTTFGERLAAGDFAGIRALFHPDAHWRDLAAFTWNIYTASGQDAIEAMAKGTALAHARAFVVDGDEETNGTETTVWFDFSTGVGTGRGRLTLRDDKAHILFTTLQQLTGFEERTGTNRNREPGVKHGAYRNRVSWLERRQAEIAQLGTSEQPYCLIVGGGQGGLGLAARLKRLGVPSLIVEQNAKPGDSWRNRYRTLCLHDPVWYDHMPYLPFPDHWPVFSPKDKLGDWLEMYAKVMELDFWGSTRCIGASYDDTRAEWLVNVEREGRAVELRPTQLVLATGMSGFPRVPTLPGSEQFGGTIFHSSDYKTGESFAGKRCVVIGSNTSAHDICADLWESGAEVTMVQRSSTIVVRSETLAALSWGTLYSEDAVARGLTTEVADLTGASTPFALTPARLRTLTEAIRKRDADLYAGLENVGFLYDFGEDDTGIGGAYPRRGGGYYIEVGASQLLIDGEIALRTKIEPTHFSNLGLHFSDGSFLAADLVVFATGYGPMNEWAAELISPEVAQRVGRCWGLGSGMKGDPGPWEGELRNMWKPTQQPGLWFHGGNLMQSRFFSRFLALQLKARFEGIATPVYGQGPVHHVE